MNVWACAKGQPNVKLNYRLYEYYCVYKDDCLNFTFLPVDE